MKRQRFKGALVVSVATALAVAGCTATPAGDGETSVTIRVASMHNEDNWNPALGGGWFEDRSGQAVYDTLFRWMGAGDAVGPWLAREYEIAEDGLSLEATLEEGIEFTDGTPLNAENVATYLTGLIGDEDWGYSGILDGQFGTTVEAVGEYGLKFTTQRPLHDLWIRAMTYVPILPPAAIDDPESFQTVPVGTGPYVLDDVQSGVSMSFVRNPDYWNPAAFDFDRVTFVILEDNVAALNALKSGQIDVTTIDATLANEAQSSGLEVSSAEGIGNMFTIMLRDRKGEVAPALGDVRVRQAMNMAFDRAAISESLYSGFSAVSSQPFPRNHIHYVEGGDDRYPFDVAAARELLADAGYPSGFDLTIATAPEFAAGQPIVEQSLADIGIRVTWDVRPDFASLTQDLTYAAVLVEMTMLGAVDWLEFFWGFSTVESEELLQVFKEAPPVESLAAAADLGEYILDDAWYVPFAHPDVLWASIPEVGIDLDDNEIELEQFKRQ